MTADHGGDVVNKLPVLMDAPALHLLARSMSVRSMKFALRTVASKHAVIRSFTTFAAWPFTPD